MIFISTSLSSSSSCCRNVRIKINTLILTSIRWYKLNKFIHFVHIKNNNNDNNSGIYSNLFPTASSSFPFDSLTFHLIRRICARFTSPHSSIERSFLSRSFIIVIVCFILRSKCHKCLLSDIHVASRTHNRRWTLMGTHTYILFSPSLSLRKFMLSYDYISEFCRGRRQRAARILWCWWFCLCQSLGIGDVRRTFFIQFICSCVSVNECERGHSCNYTAILCRFLIQSGSYACPLPLFPHLLDCIAALSDIRMKYSHNFF